MKFKPNINNFPARNHYNSYRDYNCDTSRLVSRVSRLRLQYSGNCHRDQVSEGINHIKIPNSENFHADQLVSRVKDADGNQDNDLH